MLINEHIFLLKIPCVVFDKTAAMTNNKLPLSIRKLTFSYWSLRLKASPSKKQGYAVHLCVEWQLTSFWTLEHTKLLLHRNSGEHNESQ